MQRACPPSARPGSCASPAAPAGSAFLATLVVVLFVIVYYFYELGVPGIANTSRLSAETKAQAITSVEKG